MRYKKINMEIKKAKIDDLIPDDLNANKGTEFGKHLMDKSFRELGCGRSILIDKNNRIIAGNKSTEQCAEIGINDVIIVETDGTKLVAVKRTDIDIDTKHGRELAIADNATSMANLEWDTEILEQLKSDFDIKTEDWTGNIGIFEPLDYSGKNKEIDTDEFSDKMEMKFILSSDEYQFIQKELAKLDESKENALLKLLNYEI